MTQVPLPKGFTGVEDLPKIRENLVNLFYMGALLRTPGIDGKGVPTGICRGAVFFKLKLYMVFGTDLTRIDPDNTQTIVGTIDGTAPVHMEPGFVFMSIIVSASNGKGYTFDGVDVVEITDSQFVPSRELAVIKSRTVYVPFNGDPLLFSDVDLPGTIKGFFDAQDLPDINTGVFNLGNDLHALGQESIQVFRNPEGASESRPFFAVEGSTADIGYLSGATRFGTSFAFIGKERDEGYSIHVMGQRDAPIISNPAVDELLTTYTTEELQTAVGSTYKWKGFLILCFRLPRHTLCFHAGNWFFQESGISGPNVTAPWTVNYIQFAYGKYYVGDATAARFGILADIPTEYGEKLEFHLDTFARSDRGAYFDINNMLLDCLTGQLLDEGTIGLTMSDDGIIWNENRTVWRGLGKTGDYGRQVSWILPGGLGTYENYAGIRLRSTSPLRFSQEALNVNNQ